MPARTVCRGGPTATTGSPTATGAPEWIMPRRRGLPVRPNMPALATPRRGSSPCTATPSSSRTVQSPPGHACGARGFSCSALACSSPLWLPSAPPPAGCFIGPVPAPPHSASTASAGLGCQNPSPSAPIGAPHADCARIATSPPRCWPPASNSPIRMIRAPRKSTTHLPTPYGRGSPPSKRGRAQSTGTSHQHHHPVLERPGPAATTRWPLLSKQHSAHPRTDQAAGPDVAGPSRKEQPPKLFGAA